MISSNRTAALTDHRVAKRTCKKKRARDDRNEHPQLRWKSASYWNHICLCRIQNLTMYKMRRRTKVPYTCDKSTQFSSQIVGYNFSCQRLSTTRQYCAEPSLLMACASLQNEHTNISGLITENWISICYIDSQGEWTQITIETQKSSKQKG